MKYFNYAHKKINLLALSTIFLYDLEAQILCLWVDHVLSMIINSMLSIITLKANEMESIVMVSGCVINTNVI